MEIKCPQCGKFFEVPDAAQDRIVRCSCKFSFKAKKLAATKEQTKSDVVVDLAMFEDTPVPTESVLSEVEVDGFSSQLKHALNVAKEKDKAPERKPIPVVSLDQEIGLMDSVPVSDWKPESIKTQPDTDPEQTVTTPSRIIRAARRKEEWYENRNAQIGLIAGGVVFVGLIVFLLIPEQKVEHKDPYLSKLIEKTEPVRPARRLTMPTPSYEVTEEKREEKKSLPTPKPVAKLEVSPTPKEEVSRPELMVAHLHGNFSEVGSADGKLSMEDEILKLEAQLLDPKVADTQKEKIWSDLQSKIDVHTLYSRAFGLACISTKKIDRIRLGVSHLESLALTRPRDPLVFAYLGMAYIAASSPSRAMNAWNQALTINPKISWVHTKVNQLIKSLQADSDL